jgi:hypothetical protein
MSFAVESSKKYPVFKGVYGEGRSALGGMSFDLAIKPSFAMEQEAASPVSIKLGT